jgi:hypothetical protein
VYEMHPLCCSCFKGDEKPRMRIECDMYMNCTLHTEDSGTIFNSVLEAYYT